ncbi:MAG TPA: bifunctional DNA-formamidopyrimidine glycosylase/DNA-(apurinic or apyrimidinic site) lyase [Methylophilaceae bacterium]|nr:bifunctional DNA-formamidopyrimidine glycosylase/DNA-(apurinic or apyrimidinic site) lyase [Methylophilaceae bacterium]
MPELPEVETTRLGLLPLVGQTVEKVILRNPAMRWPVPSHLIKTLPGQQLQALQRRAKYILARFDTGTLILHLGMSGRIILLQQDDPAQKHDHFEVQFGNGNVLRLRDPRRFGAVLWCEGEVSEHVLLQALGPEPLEEAFTGALLYSRTRTRPAPVKNVIMDSTVVVGVGNIYASESLFRAGIHPGIAANRISKTRYQRLAEEIKATLQDALKAGGSSLRDFFGTDGNPGYFQQQYFVYGRTGKPCRKCATPIKSIKLGQRSTFYCPVCQRK